MRPRRRAPRAAPRRRSRVRRDASGAQPSRGASGSPPPRARRVHAVRRRRGDRRVLLASRGSDGPTGLELTPTAGRARAAARPARARLHAHRPGRQDRHAARRCEGQPVGVRVRLLAPAGTRARRRCRRSRGALDDLDDADVSVVGISVDPANDTRKRAHAFLLKQGMTGRMDFLLGTRAELAAGLEGVRDPAPAGRTSSTRRTRCSRIASGFQRIGFPFDQLTRGGARPTTSARL